MKQFLLDLIPSLFPKSIKNVMTTSLERYSEHQKHMLNVVY